jgi:hypothetical protein
MVSKLPSRLTVSVRPLSTAASASTFSSGQRDKFASVRLLPVA